MLDPEFALIVAIVGAVGAVAGATALEVGRKLGPQIESKDLVPAAPWQGPPLPRFVYTKPELVRDVLRGRL
jgi:hypothetical protein